MQSTTSALDQRRDLSRDWDLQHCWDILGPRFRGCLLDRIELLNTDSVAAVSLRDRDEVHPGQLETGNPRRALENGERLQDRVLLVPQDDDQQRKSQLRRVPERLDRILSRPVTHDRDNGSVPTGVALGECDSD